MNKAPFPWDDVHLEMLRCDWNSGGAANGLARRYGCSAKYINAGIAQLRGMGCEIRPSFRTRTDTLISDDRIRELRDGGASIRMIAATAGCSQSAIRKRILKQTGRECLKDVDSSANGWKLIGAACDAHLADLRAAYLPPKPISPAGERTPRIIRATLETSYCGSPASNCAEA